MEEYTLKKKAVQNGAVLKHVHAYVCVHDGMYVYMYNYWLCV